ncbi:uncharacterized protein MYCFIDRAFT_176624 [Pseudocercospora fijiensis CIRAD86]|uniref:Uncharacterized protein n=1 Tax=Pseudocercospora fijiensis (strain CIRAD86) TaxID=383855 RepID=M2ZQI9_PSEFD|nr:uncharacterized protein MYCFIDRAFT_176624 [Pseudocercospora fijiensis CIRAD86]EME81339.1 hypothetical protein MYCFIDRAFT_176624 [Pseudocercospora fijiensis CIRAD86]
MLCIVCECSRIQIPLHGRHLLSFSSIHVSQAIFFAYHSIFEGGSRIGIVKRSWRDGLRRLSLSAELPLVHPCEENFIRAHQANAGNIKTLLPR